MIIYVDLDENNKIVRGDTNRLNSSMVELDVDDSYIDSGKLLCSYYIDGEVVFSQEDYDKIEAEKQAYLDKIEAEKRLKELETTRLLSTLDDEQAPSFIVLFPVWDGNKVSYKKDERLSYNNKLYKVIDEHISQNDLTPDIATFLYTML